MKRSSMISGQEFIIFMGSAILIFALIIYYIWISSDGIISNEAQTTAEVIVLILFPLFGYVIVQAMQKIRALEENEKQMRSKCEN